MGPGLVTKGPGAWTIDGRYYASPFRTLMANKGLSGSVLALFLKLALTKNTQHEAQISSGEPLMTPCLVLVWGLWGCRGGVVGPYDYSGYRTHKTPRI